MQIKANSKIIQKRGISIQSLQFRYNNQKQLTKFGQSAIILCVNGDKPLAN